jgi:hypothetical protein
MKLGEIKEEALKLMFANTKKDFTYTNFETLKEDPNFAGYLNSMNGAINRSFDKIKSLKKQPKEIHEVDTTLTTGFLRVDTTTIPNYDRVIRVTYESETEYLGNVDYMMEGKYILLKDKLEEAKYRIIYSKKMPYITSATTDATEIALPDELLRIIPFYIKYNLYEEDEPELAARAKNEFDEGLLLYEEDVQSIQRKVVDVYEGT